MDKARQRTDKQLAKIEREMGRIYKNDPALKHIEKEYADYMAKVKKQTEAEYEAYKADPEKKQEYTDKVRALTLESAEYKRLVKKIVAVLADVNQQALDVSNDAMIDIYTMNYNQVAEECKRVGIRVDGEE